MKPATVPPNAPLLDPTTYKAENDTAEVPVAYFLPQKFPPTQLCEYCPHSQNQDPTQQAKVAIGSVNGKRVCQFHLAMFELDPHLANVRLP